MHVRRWWPFDRAEQRGDVDTRETLRRLAAHHVRDDRTPVATLGDVALVAHSPHQLNPSTGDAFGIPAWRPRPG